MPEALTQSTSNINSDGVSSRSKITETKAEIVQSK